MMDPPALTTLLLATTNAGKAREYAGLFADLPLRLVTLADLNVTDEVDETGDTFLANARLKAAAGRAAAQAAGLAAWVLGDDSGLEVDALGGAPGVFSVRWAGPNTTAAERNTLLLARLDQVPPAQRTARFRCVISLLDPAGQEWVGDGTLEGRITFAPRQQPGYGFGYDPIFELPERGLTVAEIPPAAKATISHRGRAVAQIRAVLARNA
ncbi:MAG: RdgB/HAM1 family non-canonical purine NTP pyrophosphatase [Chloroflexota bacterium]|nr:RdgB/HAM1 family non-canonical purine NTP pyrophosphatase [Chloroflexota bacterium]